MRTIIAGGRHFGCLYTIRHTINNLPDCNKPSSVSCGKAKGADTLGEVWAVQNAISVDYFDADWDELGKRAGFVRNVDMAKHSEQLIAFWDGKSKGTKHMIDTALKYKLVVHIIRY